MKKEYEKQERDFRESVDGQSYDDVHRKKIKKMEQGQHNGYLYRVGEEGKSAFVLQDGASKVTDSQGFVYGNIDKSSNHVDKSKSQVIRFQIRQKILLYKSILHVINVVKSNDYLIIFRLLTYMDIQRFNTK